jgi:hypothetical protein
MKIIIDIIMLLTYEDYYGDFYGTKIFLEICNGDFSW